jgi:hypothetical protein
MALDREDLQQLEASIVRALKIPTSGKTANNLFNSSAADFKEAIKRQIEKMQDLGKQYGVSETQLIKFRLMAEENTKELAKSQSDICYNTQSTEHCCGRYQKFF